MDFETFEKMLDCYDQTIGCANKLIEIGFAIHSEAVQKHFNLADDIAGFLNRKMGLKEDQYGTTIDWFLENRKNDDPDLHRITIDGKEFMIYSAAQLYNFITEYEK